MIINTYPKILSRGILILLIATLFACEQNETDPIPPTLNVHFINENGLKDTSAEAGNGIIILISGASGSENITYLSILRNGQHVLDSGLNSNAFVCSRLIIKNTDSIEHYTILIRDRNFLETRVSFSIALLPTSSYGQIRTMNHIVLGAQNNVANGSFLNLFSGSVFNLSQAYFMQDSIQMLYFYDASDLNTIASPNANIDTSYFGGNYGLANWTQKNEIRYNQLFIGEGEFNASQNDSLIIAHLFPYETGKRKAKALQAGNIYEFSFNGLYGIFFVHNVSGANSGNIEISIKMQQQ